ncbi:DUF167 domain-containing protein [Desulfovibrio sp. OttesenSCG-928-A18]|nr:DUF167 domain-containing protein [Desulfovibrio sp. OttesenSCG-928-A18]
MNTSLQDPDQAELPPFVSRAKEGGWHLLVRVQPGAKKSEVCAPAEGRLRVRLAAPAMENKANKALVLFMARLLGLKSGRVKLVSGASSREKRLYIDADCAPDWGAIRNAVKERDS